MDLTKVCTSCQQGKSIDEYAPHPRGLLGRQSKCRKCQAAAMRKRRSEKSVETKRLEGRRWMLSTKFGLTPEQYDAIAVEQNGKCAICKQQYISWRWEHSTVLMVDHDHECCSSKSKTCGKCVRGLLCGDCNSMIGYAKDNIQTLNSAIEYLSKYNRLNI